jgi:Cu-Zn family superoxide dismutase
MNGTLVLEIQQNILGKGLIVHEGTDDFVSQPSGNAGARVACSAIIK